MPISDENPNTAIPNEALWEIIEVMSNTIDQLKKKIK
jgi:hypothetical protein